MRPTTQLYTASESATTPGDFVIGQLKQSAVLKYLKCHGLGESLTREIELNNELAALIGGNRRQSLIYVS
jgi:hypothetical protein